jgi:DNA topoisomerase-3
MQKLLSQKLKMSSAMTMNIAEKLYNKGFISYPRTETTSYKKKFNLRSLVKKQEENNSWGDYAKNLVEGGQFMEPRNGKQDDKAHPPIHPVRMANKGMLSADEWKVYELITRHFLAVCSKDATGLKTIVE